MKKVTDKDLVDRIRAFQRTDKANKRCADCTEVGPTYVCLSFSTFVCTTCSGLHREFSNKVKGISVSKWTVEEVEEIERGGNARAAEKWLCRWEPRDFAEPDGSDPVRCRDFLRKKYIERRWMDRGADQDSRSRRDDSRGNELRRDRDIEGEGRRRQVREGDAKPRGNVRSLDGEEHSGDRSARDRDDRYDRDHGTCRRADRSHREEASELRSSRDTQSHTEHQSERNRRGDDSSRGDEGRHVARDRDHDRNYDRDSHREQQASSNDRDRVRRGDLPQGPLAAAPLPCDDFQPNQAAASNDWAAFPACIGDIAVAAVAPAASAAVGQHAANALLELDPSSFTQVAVPSAAVPPAYIAAVAVETAVPINPFAAPSMAAVMPQVGSSGFGFEAPVQAVPSRPTSDFSAFEELGGSQNTSQSFPCGHGQFTPQSMQPGSVGSQMPHLPQQGIAMPAMLTPQQVAQMSPQQIAQAQMMMQAQMQMLMQAMGTVGGVTAGMPPYPYQQPLQHSLPLPSSSVAEEIAPSSPGGGQFKDLIAAFHQKNVVNGGPVAHIGGAVGGAAACASALRVGAASGVGAENPFDMFA